VQDGATLAAKVLRGVTPIFTRQCSMAGTRQRDCRIHSAATQADYLLQVNVWPLSQQAEERTKHSAGCRVDDPGSAKDVFASGDDAEVYSFTRHPSARKTSKTKR